MVFGSKQEEINELQETVARQHGEITRLQGLLAIEQCVGPIADEVRAELTRLDREGIIDGAAQTAAAVAVSAVESARVTEELSERLQSEKHEYFAAKFRSEEAPAIHAGLVSLFESNGTFEKLKAEAEASIYAEIQTEVLDEAKARIVAEVDTEEARNSFRQQIQAEIDESDEITEYRSEAQEEFESQWRDEAVDEAKQKIKAEEAKREQTFKEWFAKQYKESYDGQRFIERTRASLEEEWGPKSIEEVAAEHRDQVLLDLLSKRADLAKAKLHEETTATELLEKFDGRGLDTSNISEGVDLVLYLGELGTTQVDESQRSRHGYMEDVKVDKPAVFCRRKLELTSLGDGRFLVDKDSLVEKDSPYDKKAAIERKVIIIGREIVEAGESSLEKRIALGVTLFFDTDTNDPEISSSLLPVANIEVDGVSANPDIIVKMV